MGNFFGFNHISSIVFATIVCGILYYSSTKTKHPRYVFTLFAVLIFLGDIAIQWTYRGNRNPVSILPLSFCGVTYMLSIAALLFNKPNLFKYSIISSIGPIIAIVFPNEGGLRELFDIVNMRHYVSHIMILYAQLFMLKQLNWRLKKNDYIKVGISIYLVSPFLYIFNMYFNTNFFYLNDMVDDHVLVDIIGPWPSNLIMFVILIFPVAFIMEKIILLLQNSLLKTTKN